MAHHRKPRVARFFAVGRGADGAGLWFGVTLVRLGMGGEGKLWQ